MSDRTKGAELAREFGAPRTANKIIGTACYARSFQSAIEEIGVPKLLDALAEAKNAEWAYYALVYIPDLTEAQRTKLYDVIADTKDDYWAYCALYYIPDLTEAQRTTLKETIAATKSAGWAYVALRNVSNLSEAQRTKLCDVIAASKDVTWASPRSSLKQLVSRFFLPSLTAFTLMNIPSAGRDVVHYQLLFSFGSVTTSGCSTT